MEMHLVSRAAQRVRFDALDLTVDFVPGETIHTENSYKYRPGQAEALLTEAGFAAGHNLDRCARMVCRVLGRVAS